MISEVRLANPLKLGELQATVTFRWGHVIEPVRTGLYQGKLGIELHTDGQAFEITLIDTGTMAIVDKKFVPFAQVLYWKEDYATTSKVQTISSEPITYGIRSADGPGDRAPEQVGLGEDRSDYPVPTDRGDTGRSGKGRRNRKGNSSPVAPPGSSG